MVYAVDGMIHLAPESITKARNTLVKGSYMKRIKKLLETEPETVISMLEALRKSLFTFDNIRVLVIADVEKLVDPVISWDSFITGLEVTKSILPIDPHIVPMPAIDSSFAVSSSKGPTSYTDPRIPALMVAVSYLEAVEGPLWSSVPVSGPLQSFPSIKRHS